MSILIVDSHATHAPVVKLVMSLGAFDIIYYSDTRVAHFDELSAFTRVSRTLKLLDTHVRNKQSTVVLLGRGMSSAPRDAVELGASRAGIAIIYAADLIVEHTCSMLQPGGLCLVGDSCMTEADVRARLDRRELFEIRWCRIAPLYGLDEPLRPILRSWGRSVGRYVLATPNNKRTASQIALEDPGAEVIDEYEHLGLALAERLPEAPVQRLRVFVTERTPATTARINMLLGGHDIRITEIGHPEPAPTDGPFAISLDADGCPA